MLTVLNSFSCLKERGSCVTYIIVKPIHLNAECDITVACTEILVTAQSNFTTCTATLRAEGACTPVCTAANVMCL